ncbi:Extracytoplasmic solute receptor protein YiaO [Thalassovita gelatinovora]|uniref:Extracytoplasmic solute receptor protein YiaO n=1 Tax=Thalassovita gelatinovora TaxID=53501 RepID=A0A0P1F6Z4_THAGE|nr:TRAP transporter substrate-binding protein [Thalassovita gelatinovora]QIZ79164.1 TRAP transporter substrate-binding protein [Thalassovita gelatinovora]CUH63621.1 Extracytoplasmic solute receptor protein YiaO [Thalassovita gelatinovora]SER00606.1 TRAP-type C4-dicarboxylate transport system, substrate-binding protein [Thalassovita gelatinovora]
MLRSITISGIAALGLTASAQAETLRYAHFMSANSWQNQVIFEDWASAVEAESGEELDVQVFPAQTLGKATAGYDNAMTGIADIAWAVPGYTAGRFPLSQILELPGLFDTGAVGSCAFQKLYDSGALDEEYDETHVLFVHTHDPGHLHTSDTPVRTLDDMKGLKLRRPTQVVGDLLENLGAEPVGMPAPNTYEALQRGAIDGYMLPWESVESFRLAELSDYHTVFGFYALAFVATMNKAKYDSLSPQAKAAVDANSGQKWAVTAGRGYDEAGAEVLAQLREESTVIELSAEERAKWNVEAQKASDSYIAALDAQGLPGTATYAAVQGYVSECEAELH